MKINVGTTNYVKLDAVKKAFSHYFDNLKIIPASASSGVREQPISMQETIEGAKNRAKNSFKDCALSVGIEAGLIECPGSSSGYINTPIIAIYDGKEFFIGGSPLLELPKEITKSMLNGSELGHIFDKITEVKHNKQKQGAVGFLTRAVLPRSKALEQGIIMALCPLLNKELYKNVKS